MNEVALWGLKIFIALLFMFGSTIQGESKGFTILSLIMYCLGFILMDAWKAC